MSSMLVAFNKYLKILPETPKAVNSQTAHIDFMKLIKGKVGLQKQVGWQMTDHKLSVIYF